MLKVPTGLNEKSTKCKERLNYCSRGFGSGLIADPVAIVSWEKGRSEPREPSIPTTIAFLTVCSMAKMALLSTY
jgi:hypothetical protein